VVGARYGRGVRERESKTGALPEALKVVREVARW